MRSLHRFASVVACAGLAAAANAQYASGFETADGISASPDGVDLNGQDEFYNPVPDTSITALAHTYMDNALGVPDNPTGGAQFVAGVGPAGGVFVRSQRDVAYGDGTGAWTVCTDILATFGGDLPSVQNIGSLSTQVYTPGTNATYISLARWTDPATAENWNADYVWFNDLGTALTEAVPDEGFQNLATNHWYRRCETFDLDTNRILSVSVTDLTTNETVTYEPPDRYLDGGAAGGLAPPNGFRFFVGSATVVGNTLAFDNMSIEAAEVPCPADCNGDGLLNILDFVCFQTEWQNQTEAGDCDGNGEYNILDFVCFQGLFQKGC